MNIISKININNIMCSSSAKSMEFSLHCAALHSYYYSPCSLSLQPLADCESVIWLAESSSNVFYFYIKTDAEVIGKAAGRGLVRRPQRWVRDGEAHISHILIPTKQRPFRIPFAIGVPYLCPVSRCESSAAAAVKTLSMKRHRIEILGRSLSRIE